MTSRLRTSLILLALFLAAWLPRVVALDAFVTVDERKWVARAANFTYALSHGDLAATYQHEHPGVTVMWAGALGLAQKFPATHSRHQAILRGTTNNWSPGSSRIRR